MENMQRSFSSRLIDALFYDHNSYQMTVSRGHPADVNKLAKKQDASVSRTGILVNIAIMGVALSIIGLILLFVGTREAFLPIFVGLGIAIAVFGTMWASRNKSIRS